MTQRQSSDKDRDTVFLVEKTEKLKKSDRVNSQKNGTKKTRDVEIELFADIVISFNFLYQAIPMEGLVIFIYLFVQITV